MHASLSQKLGSGPTAFHIYRLTWDGHELLEAIRSDTVWNKARGAIMESTGTMTFDLVKDMALHVAKTMLGI